MKTKTPDKKTIVLGINSLVSTKHIAYSNHIQLMFRLGRSYPHNIILHNPARMSIDRFRNLTAQLALESQADYVLFLDDDVLVPHEIDGQPPFSWLQMLIDMDADIAAGDVLIRGYPFNHMLFRKGKTKATQYGLYQMPRLPEPRGVIDVDAVGCSLTLIKTSLFKKVPPPFFVTGPQTNTEDIYFCYKARQIDPTISIKADTRIKCHHILWEETIGSENKAAMKRYYESIIGKPTSKRGKKMDEMLWRGGGYRNEVEATLNAAVGVVNGPA